MRHLVPVLLSLTFALTGFALTPEAVAACGANPGIISTTENPYRSYVWTADVFAAHPAVNPAYTYVYDVVPPVSSSFGISFWAIGAGNPAPLAGVDNGTFDPVQQFSYGVYVYPDVTFYFGGELFTGFQPGTDGCPSQVDPPNVEGICMAVLFDDQNGTRGSFALATAATGPTLTTTIAQPNSDPIILLPIPAPDPLSVQGELDGISVQATVPGINLATYELDGCPADAEARIYYSTVPAGGAAPADRDRTLWTAAGPGPFALDQPAWVSVACSVGEDVYLAAALTFDSGYETTYVSENVGPLDCLGAADTDNDGFTIADDCDDTNPDINPGAAELPGNRVDENCDGLMDCNPDDFCEFGQYVVCVRNACDPLIDAGIITQPECNDLIIRNGNNTGESIHRPDERLHNLRKSKGAPTRYRRSPRDGGVTPSQSNKL